MRQVDILVSAGGHEYTTARQCTSLIGYIQQITSIVLTSRNLQFARIYISAFTPADCSPNLWPGLQPANDHLVTLVAALIGKRPHLDLVLGRPDDMAEAQVETISTPLFNDILTTSRGRFRSLRIGCRLTLLLPCLRGNPQLKELYYTRLASGIAELDDFWDVIWEYSLTKLMLDGFEFPAMTRLPVGLQELLLTHLDDTITATNAILRQLPHLKVLSLRLQRNNHSTATKVISPSEIVCRGLKTVWWTMSHAPLGATAEICTHCPLESLSLPRNVTDLDLQAVSRSTVKELWLMDCPGITEIGFAMLGRLGGLKYLQIQERLVRFLTEEVVRGFIAAGVLRVTIVFSESRGEAERREQLRREIPGREGYFQILLDGVTFRASTLGDQIIIDIKSLPSLF
jgi:hypothetical protein